MPPLTAPKIFDNLTRKAKSMTLGGEKYYVVEGDLLLNETELFAYAAQQATLVQAEAQGLVVQRQGLMGIQDDQGRLVRWRKGLVLTYAVRRETFAEQTQYDLVVQAMHEATAGWEGLCGVNFRHLTQCDVGPLPETEKPIFRVEGHDARSKYIAVAFFPDQLPARRIIFIDPSFFLPNLGFNQTGVLRHELGHVLGFRHEHIRTEAPGECPDELMRNTVGLTPYDSQSVMHYLCGGVGNPELIFTQRDAEGAMSVYGPPDHKVTYYE